MANSHKEHFCLPKTFCLGKNASKKSSEIVKHGPPVGLTLTGRYQNGEHDFDRNSVQFTATWRNFLNPQSTLLSCFVLRLGVFERYHPYRRASTQSRQDPKTQRRIQKLRCVE
jgi:hypothetical protein